jgi:phosphoribosylformylglycinamidine (FGAM) synthase PurS component
MKRIQETIAALQKQKEAGPIQKLKGSSTAAYFQLTLGAKDAAWPFQVEEFGEDSKPMGSIAFQNAAVLGRFLSRVMKDPTAPKTVRIAAADRTPKALIESALEECKTAGIARSLVVEDKADPRVILDPFDDSIRKALEKLSRENVRELEEGRKRQVELDALSAAEKLMQKQQLDKADQDYLKKYYELIDRANELLKSQKEEQQKQNPPKP